MLPPQFLLMLYVLTDIWQSVINNKCMSFFEIVLYSYIWHKYIISFYRIFISDTLMFKCQNSTKTHYIYIVTCGRIELPFKEWNSFVLTVRRTGHFVMFQFLAWHTNVSTTYKLFLDYTQLAHWLIQMYLKVCGI